MVKKLGAISLVLMFAAFSIVACGPKKDPVDQPEEDPKKPYNATGNEGSVAGVIKFDGTPPAPKRIDMSQDAACATAAGEKTTDDVVVTDGKLAAVYVYVTGGRLKDFSFGKPSESAHLDQVGCKYVPRVLGLQTGQTLRVTNSDPTTHNVHPTPSKNPEWNQSQTPGQAAIEKKFSRAETLIPVKCNQHPWMKSHVGVLDHPFFAVSKKDGTFKIEGLPPGDYTLVAWHEMGGDKGTEKTAKITIGAKEAKTQDFTFGSATASAPPVYTQVQPALILP
jgi:plastocyanin